MRRIFILMAVVFLGAQADAARNVNWVKRAPVSAAYMRQAVAEAALAEVSGPRPVVLIETNYYTFGAGEPVQVRLTTHPNGYGGAASLYLYRENRTSGERRYYNVATGLQAAGAHSDLFGSASSPAPIFVPTLSDFVLFGSTTDTSELSWGVNGALGGSMIVAAGDIGLYQWVAELRDAAGKRVLARSNAMYSHVEATVPVSGTITSSQTWTSNNRYVLNDFVGVAAPAVLTIEPGTVIYGGNTRATLFIQRGAKIIADGTARRPIVFTSAQQVGSRARADWGSLVLFGNAPITVDGGTAYLEGLPSEPAYTYGGTDAADSSGVLRYVRLEFGGFEIQTDQEINGLTLAGVGNGTEIDHVEVLHNKDDGFEFFGGTVNAKHLLGVAIHDDALDFDLGYSGSVQFAAFIKRATSDEGDSNILTESDNGPKFDLAPRTNPLVYNVTAVRETNTSQGNHGAVLRRGTAGNFHNIIVLNSRRAPVTLRDTATFNGIAAGELVFDHSLLFGDFSDAAYTSSSDRAADTRTFLFTTMTRNRNIDPMLAIGVPTLLETFLPDLEPLDDSPALDASYVANPPDNGFLEAVDYIGAVGPGDNWILSGWANFSDN